MSRFFIQLEDGIPTGHPIAEDNFVQVHPNIDMDNLPDNFALFVRTSAPQIGVYKKNQQEQYALQDDGSYQSNWVSEEMTDAEKTAKQNEAKAAWAAIENTPNSWAFNEYACWYEPPSPYPDDGNLYRWDEASLSWVEESL